MAPRYQLIDDFGGGTYIGTSPTWVIAVWRFDIPISFDRSTMKSVQAMGGDGAKLRGANPLIISSECPQLTVTTNKDSHLTSLSAKLNSGPKNFIVEILPGDWVMAWIVNYEDQAVELIDNLRNLKPANSFKSGLKFVGRVDSIQNDMKVDRPGGKVDSTYSLNCSGFKELDTILYYDLALKEKAIDNIGYWMYKLGEDLEKIFKYDKNESPNNVVKILTSFFEAILGRGVPASRSKFGKNNDVQNIYQGTDDDPNTQEAPFAYLVPEDVGKALDRTSRSKKGGVLAFPDIFEFIYGVQEYENANSSSPEQRFQPKFKDGGQSNQTYKDAGSPLLGSFLPVGITVINKPLWSILNEYLNPVVNEMYVTLRVNSDGKILPTVIARQIPFTSNVFNNEGQKIEGPTQDGSVMAENIKVTRFLDLPRWVMHPALFAGGTIGRSDATRTNFVHVYGQSRLQKGVPQSYQIVVNPPIVDSLDIQRSGIRPFIGSTACEVADQVGKAPTVWMQLIADRMINSQLTVNGTISMVGVQAPIPVGDNLEWNGVVYHIESVTHNCFIDHEMGQKSFMTTLSLTHGMRNLDDNEASGNVANNADDLTGKSAGNGTVDESFQKSNDFPVYPGISTKDNMKYQPGITEESKFHTNVREKDEDPQGQTSDPDLEIKPTGKPGGENLS